MGHIAAAICAGKHLVAMSSLLHRRPSLLSPVKLGHYVHIRATVNYASTTSMEVGVRVDSENPLTGEVTHCSTAYTTFVALGEHGRPTPVPQIVPETPAEKRRYEAAKKRRASRMALAESLKLAAQAEAEKTE